MKTEFFPKKHIAKISSIQDFKILTTQEILHAEFGTVRTIFDPLKKTYFQKCLFELIANLHTKT